MDEPATQAQNENDMREMQIQCAEGKPKNVLGIAQDGQGLDKENKKARKQEGGQAGEHACRKSSGPLREQSSEQLGKQASKQENEALGGPLVHPALGKARASTARAGKRPIKKKTSEDINQAVEQALLRKATGYTYCQQESYKLKHVAYEQGTGKKQKEWESVEVVEVEKYVPPEYSAIALWLKARMPRVWGEAAQAVVTEQVVIVDDIPAQSGENAALNKSCVAQQENNTKGIQEQVLNVAVTSHDG